VVKLIQQAVADGANLIQQQGDTGLTGLSPLTLSPLTNGHHRKKGIACALDD
jgi:hypothetical protein